MDDVARTAREAAKSAAVTHSHPEGQAGAVAIAVAAAIAWSLRGHSASLAGPQLLQAAYKWTPDGATREGIARAIDLSPTASVDLAATALGTSAELTAPDTVPFTLWCAARHGDDFAEAMWTTVSGLGDRDTACAIVGGIVALSAMDRGIPRLAAEARTAAAAGGRELNLGNTFPTIGERPVLLLKRSRKVRV